MATFVDDFDGTAGTLLSARAGWQRQYPPQFFKCKAIALFLPFAGIEIVGKCQVGIFCDQA